MARLSSIELRELKGMDAFPVLAADIPDVTSPNANKSDVVQVLLEALPVPDGSTSWEQIIEYRNDPDSGSKFLALRNWMNEVARAGMTTLEVEQKLEYLMDQYQQHLKLHRVKTTRDKLKTLIEAGAGWIALGGIGIAKPLFSMHPRTIALMEGELTAPGREVAYIVKARQNFC